MSKNKRNFRCDICRKTKSYSPNFITLQYLPMFSEKKQKIVYKVCHLCAREIGELILQTKETYQK